MRSLEELQAFYQSDLLPLLTDIDIKRQKIVQILILSLSPLAGIALLVLGWSAVSGSFSSDLLIFTIVIVGLISGAIYHFTTRAYILEFKDAIIERLVAFLDPALRYSKLDSVTESEFLASGIFLKTPDIYHGEDLVEGAVGKTSLKFSEVHAKYVTRDSKGRRRTHTIFRGLLFIADFHKDFQGRTFVLPDISEKMLGQLGNMLQSWNPSRPELVRLEDPRFEKEFAVYADDQVEARYILSTSLMERILAFKQKSKSTLSLSFIRSRVYIALATSRNLFEPRVFHTMMDFEPIRQYFTDLELALGIVDDLNLNTRIWSKA